MDLTIDEFKSLSADMTGQRMRIAELESELNASRAECAALRQEILRDTLDKIAAGSPGASLQ